MELTLTSALVSLLVTLPSSPNHPIEQTATPAVRATELPLSADCAPITLSRTLIAGKTTEKAQDVDVNGDPLRRCFRDKNGDNKCDKSVNAGGKCPRNCVRAAPSNSATPAPTQAGTGCSGCGGCLLT